MPWRRGRGIEKINNYPQKLVLIVALMNGVLVLLAKTMQVIALL